MHYTGVDIIEISRIEKAIIRWGERFFHRLYSEAERKLCRKRPASFATRFAGKEAVMKALGTGARGVSWREIEILSEPGGKPVVHLSGKAQERANTIGLTMLDISLSDSKEYAVAFVVGDTK